MNTTDHHPSETSYRAIAAGILKQVRIDLRRFDRGTVAVERQLYCDAYEWIISDDRIWPFSFLNVCDALAVSPAHLRQELIGQLAPGIGRYRMRGCRRMMGRLRTSFSQLLAHARNADASYASQLTGVSHEPTSANL